MSYGAQDTTEAGATGTWTLNARIADPEPMNGNPLHIRFVMTVPSTNEYGPSGDALTEIDDLAQDVLDFLAVRYPGGTITGIKDYQASREITLTP